jgi:hypothetical protein
VHQLHLFQLQLELEEQQEAQVVAHLVHFQKVLMQLLDQIQYFQQ